MKKYKATKKKETQLKREIIIEPTRRSLYDVLQTNLKLAKRINYLHRLIYIGEHKYPHGEIADAKENLYKITNSTFNPEPLSGILLHYSNFFCCIIEGSERALANYVILLYENLSDRFMNLKLLKVIHHVKARFNENFLSHFANPPERVEDIDADSNLEVSLRYVTDCCEKLYNFANAFIEDQTKVKEDEDVYLDPHLEDSDVQTHKRPTRGRLMVRDPYARFLPELKLLNFLCKCKYIKDLHRYIHYYKYIGQSKDFNLKVWPTPKNFVRYDIFDETYNPITDLPPLQGEIITKEEEEPDMQSLADANPI